MTRQDFLKLMAAGGLTFLSGAEAVKAADPKRGSLTPWGRLKFVGKNDNLDDWGVHPQGDMNLVDHMLDNTSVNISKRWNVADIEHLEEMVQYPMLFMHAEVTPVFEDQHRKNLREYLLRGGFLYAEDCVIGKGYMGRSHKNDFFFTTMAQELPSLVPEATFERLPKDHPLYHCFYHLRDGLPHCQGTPHGGHGLTLNGRLIAFLSPSDNHCGWTGNWFGKRSKQLAFWMGTNLYVYAMTQGGGIMAPTPGGNAPMSGSGIYSPS